MGRKVREIGADGAKKRRNEEPASAPRLRSGQKGGLYKGKFWRVLVDSVKNQGALDVRAEKRRSRARRKARGAG